MTMENANLADPYTCTVRIMSPKGKSKVLRKIVSPLTKWIDPQFQIVQIGEGKHTNSEKLTCSGDNSDDETLHTPAVSIMLFLSDNGAMTYDELKTALKKKPWKLHHKMELKSKISPDRTIGCQEFYGLADDLPLWSVCPIHCGNEHLRFLLQVKKFKEMVEFYRIITNAEMESSKPGFCIFPLYSQPGLDCQLALKYSKYIDPVPMENVILVFKVSCMNTIKASISTNVTQLDATTFVVYDPDGNKIHLKSEPVSAKPAVSGVSTMSAVKNILEDYKCYKSSSDSYDSGRFSDSDLWFSEAEHATCDITKHLQRNGVIPNEGNVRNKPDRANKQTSEYNRRSERSDTFTNDTCRKESVYL